MNIVRNMLFSFDLFANKRAWSRAWKYND